MTQYYLPIFLINTKKSLDTCTEKGFCFLREQRAAPPPALRGWALLITPRGSRAAAVPNWHIIEGLIFMGVAHKNKYCNEYNSFAQSS
jgi:hypothetical protein